MEEKTQQKQRRIVELLQDELDLAVTGIEINEYVRGNPVEEDADVAGAEVEVRAYLSYEDGEDEENPYRVK